MVAGAFCRTDKWQFPAAEVEGFRHQLKEIQASMVDGKFLAEGSSTPAGQEIVIGLLDRCLLWSEIVISRSVHPYEVFLTAAV